MNHRTIGHDRDLATIAEYFAFTNFQQLRFALNVCASPVTSRITHGGRSVVLDHGKQHIAHLALVLWRHDHNVRYAAKISDIEKSMMCLSITSSNTTPVETELDIHVLNTDVVHQLIVPTLQKRGVDSTDRL